MEQFTVLIVEDDPLIADIAEESLTTAGYFVCGIAANIRQGIALAIKHQPELAVVDIRLADGDLGTKLAAELKRISNIAILYASSSLDLLSENDVGEAYITKPYTLDGLCKAVSVLVPYVRTGKIEAPCPQGMVFLNT